MEPRATAPLHLWLSLLLMLLGVGSTLSVSADELIMKDGSRLLGKVLTREDGTLDFKTTYAGVIKVKWSHIASISSEKPIELMLSDDSFVTGNRIKCDTEDLILESDNGTTAFVAQKDVVFVNPETWRKGSGYKLSGHANVALERARGNTDSDEVDVDGDLTWRRRKDRFQAFGEWERDKTNNQLTTEKWRLDGTYSYFVTEKWYWGGFVRLEHDKFADLDLRTSVGPQFGYQWFESREMNLSTASGISYINEDFISQPDDDYAALPWSINFDRYVFGDVIQFYHKQTGFWNLEHTNNVIWDTWTGLRFPLILGVVTSTEVKVEYNSGAAEGADEVDTTYSLKLGYQW
jgi:putative salt-induced outer membrane protein YdiY